GRAGRRAAPGGHHAVDRPGGRGGDQQRRVPPARPGGPGLRPAGGRPAGGAGGAPRRRGPDRQGAGPADRAVRGPSHRLLVLAACVVLSGCATGAVAALPPPPTTVPGPPTTAVADLQSGVLSGVS